MADTRSTVWPIKHDDGGTGKTGHAGAQAYACKARDPKGARWTFGRFRA